MRPVTPEIAAYPVLAEVALNVRPSLLVMATLVAVEDAADEHADDGDGEAHGAQDPAVAAAAAPGMDEAAANSSSSTC